MIQRIHTWPSVSGRWLLVWSAFGCSESYINRYCRKTDYDKSKSWTVRDCKRVTSFSWEYWKHSSLTSSYVKGVVSLGTSKCQCARSASTCGLMPRPSGFVYKWWRKVRLPFGNCEWNVDWQLGPRNQTKIYAVEARRFPTFKEI